MPTDRSTSIKTWVRLTTALDGFLLVGVAVIGLPAAVRMAEILYAEDFDRSGGVPAWFAPWHLAMSYPTTAAMLFFVLGIVLVIAGVTLNKPALRPPGWVNTVMVATLTLCFLTAVALVPLSTMGGDWPITSPAYEVRRTVIASTAVVWVVVMLLMASIFSIRRHEGLYEGSKHSEA